MHNALSNLDKTDFKDWHPIPPILADMQYHAHSSFVRKVSYQTQTGDNQFIHLTIVYWAF